MPLPRKLSIVFLGVAVLLLTSSSDGDPAPTEDPVPDPPNASADPGATVPRGEPAAEPDAAPAEDGNRAPRDILADPNNCRIGDNNCNFGG